MKETSFIDVALTIHELVPTAKYFGSVTANSKEAFDSIRWRDDRPKPSWAEMKAKWTELESTLGVKEAEEALINEEMKKLAIDSLVKQGKISVR